MFKGNVHLLVHRFAAVVCPIVHDYYRFGVLGYNPALLRIYDSYLKDHVDTLGTKQLCLVSWSYARNNIYIQSLFERIGLLHFHLYQG